MCLCKYSHMICRKKEYRTGDLVTVTHCWGGYRLPIDLPDGETVKILWREAGNALVSYQGKQFTISTANVESGWEYRFKGQWRDETDPLLNGQIKNEKLKSSRSTIKTADCVC